MSELRALVEAARQQREKREPFLSATVVRVRGSGYRRAGARMIASQDQWLAGSISGGCLERDVITKGFWRTRSERALLVTYDESEDALDERAGTGSQGIVEVLLEKHSADAAEDADGLDAYAAAERCIRNEAPVAVVSVFHSTHRAVPVGARLIVTADEPSRGNAFLRAELEHEAQAALRTCPVPYLAQRTTPDGEVEVLIEVLVPPPHLFVFGSGHDVTPLVTIAKNIGWSVSVWDALPRTVTRERLRAADHYLTGSLEDAVARLSRCVRSIAIVMAHHLEQDRASLAALLPSRALYVGVLGPRVRTQQMLADCRAAGIPMDAAQLARVYAPVGLQLGAQTPAEIALAIVAEAQAALTRSEVATLRSQSGAIHRSAPTLPVGLAPLESGV